jgi:ABC-2 type transport system ATP-binding protein
MFEAEATVEVTDEGLTVTSQRAREVGTDLLVALRDADIPVTGFNVRAPTLDDVFLAITGEHVAVEEPGAEAAPAEVGR